MIVYRVGKTKFANDLTGEGARLHGGRWNHVFTPCIYTSESRALAVLEFTVNINIDFIPRALSITTYEIPDTAIMEFTIAELPGDLSKAPAPASTKDFGTNLLRQLTAPVIKVPSVIIHQEYNYLLNPKHPVANTFKIIDITDFVYDVRIKTV